MRKGVVINLNSYLKKRESKVKDSSNLCIFCESPLLSTSEKDVGICSKCEYELINKY